MGLEWTSMMAVGVDAIDTQHRQLFEQINRLLEACNQGKGKESIDQIVNFLEKYVVNHFQAEQKLMQETHYPDYLKHKGLHEQFIESFGRLKEQIAKEGNTINIVILTNRMVVGWLNDHILNVDKELGKYLNSRK